MTVDYKKQAENLLYDAKDWGGDPHIRKDLYGAAQSITNLLARAEAAEARAEKSEMERDESLELLHSYRRICGEKTPEDLQRIVDSQDFVDKMVSDMYKLLLAVESAIKTKDLSIFRNRGKVGIPENRIPFLTALGKIETEYEELLYMSCSAVELKNRKEE